jgi:hypothetical protein
MLKLGKLTDYAITVMVQLAKEGVSRSANYLSKKIGGARADRRQGAQDACACEACGIGARGGRGVSLNGE